MKISPRILLGVILGLIGLASVFLARFESRRTLGKPGVKVGPLTLFDPAGNPVAKSGVLLPEAVDTYRSRPLPVTTMELNGLPKDTTFGKRIYRAPDGFEVQLNVVLMGTDRTSIHQPQYCLVGQGWTVDRTEDVRLKLGKPRPYELGAKKLVTSLRARDESGRPTTYSGVFVYWFVTDDLLTADPLKRMWWMARDLLQKQVLERWAYVSYFSVCPVGGEDAAFDRMKQFITASVPEFQLASGQPKSD